MCLPSEVQIVCEKPQRTKPGEGTCVLCALFVFVVIIVNLILRTYDWSR